MYRRAITISMCVLARLPLMLQRDSVLCSSATESVVLACEVALGRWRIVHYDTRDRAVINCVSVMVCCTMMCYCDGASLTAFMLCLITTRRSSFPHSAIELQANDLIRHYDIIIVG